MARPKAKVRLAVNPRRRRRRRRSYRRNPMHMAANPRRRRRRSTRRGYHRRSYRRNPASIKTLGTELGWAVAGFMGTKIVGNLVNGVVGGIGQGNDFVRIGIKVGIAYAAAWMFEQFMGRRVFVPTFVGGSIEAIQDTVKTFVTPYVPMLAAAEYPLQSYYKPAAELPIEGLSAYGTSGDVAF